MIQVETTFVVNRPPFDFIANFENNPHWHTDYANLKAVLEAQTS